MNVIAQAAAAGRPTYGIWAAGPSAIAAETLGRCGLDWILLDMQHGAVHAGNLLELVQGVELGGGHALVRVAQNDPALIGRALDLGAVGVVVPLVSTAEQAAAAAAATRYPPRGSRSFGPIRNFYGLDAADASVSCLVMIETAEALDNLAAIAATPGVDGLFVGPVDLGLALGEGLAVPPPPGGAVDEAIATVIAAAHDHGILAGVAGLDRDHAEALLVAGADLVTVGSDVGHLAAGLRADVTRTRDWTTRFTTTKTTAVTPAP